MFTQQELEDAHNTVKSGADFPAYIQKIKALGVTHYETFVCDGSINYFGNDSYNVEVAPKYDKKHISETLNKEEFISGLKAHQAGETDFLTFISMCADAGIHKWEINLERMECVYFDQSKNEVLTEEIPH